MYGCCCCVGNPTPEELREIRERQIAAKRAAEEDYRWRLTRPMITGGDVDVTKLEPLPLFPDE